jgi:hypothetical protein
MKLTTGILVAVTMTGALWAQNPNATQNAQSTTNAVQQQKTQNSNAALGSKNAPTSQSAKPAAGALAKPATTATSAPQKNAPVPAAASNTPVPVAKAKAAPAAKTQPVPVVKTKAAVAVGKVVAPQPAIAAKKIEPKKDAKTVLTATPSAADNKKAEAKTAEAKAVDAGKSLDTAKAAPKPEEKKWAMTGKRDPFFSPIVQAPTGSGCSTGKKCLEIGQINLHGVVKSDTGFIAVVTNNLGKAYFLRENDPVFNGYVMRITGDTVVFQETYEDKLGKPLTREVVKRIFTPAV